MKIRTSLITIIVILMTMGYMSFAFGAVSEEEANKLGGPVLTPMGAERAGNKNGTIPAWTGVPIPIPKGFKKGSGLYVDPFADEKPLFSINQKNMSQYADKLAEGVKALMKRNPDYRIDVYPTHRTLVFPQYYYEKTKKNATVCEVVKNGLAVGGNGCHGGSPFPIPKTGNELFWNHTLAFEAPEGYSSDIESYNITSSGKMSLSSAGLYTGDYPWNDPKKENDWRYVNYNIKFTGPARRNGEILLVSYSRDYADHAVVIWQYLPGQRRVRLAPDICCDTPNASTGGASTYDDTAVFTGNPERYEWRLVGKKEMYVPYNGYKWLFFHGPANVGLLPHFLNPDLVRWELHRVWVVEATLKPKKRHVYTKRLFYADEDSGAFIIADNFDNRGELYRMTVSHQMYTYDVQSLFRSTLAHYDMISNAYAVYLWPRKSTGVQYMKFHSDSIYSPDSIAGGGLR